MGKALRNNKCNEVREAEEAKRQQRSYIKDPHLTPQRVLKMRGPFRFVATKTNRMNLYTPAWITH